MDKNKPDQDLFPFYNEWMNVYRDMYGAGKPSKEMQSCIHEHFYEQMSFVPKMKDVMNWYDLSTDEVGHGIKTYEWLLEMLEKKMTR